MKSFDIRQKIIKDLRGRQTDIINCMEYNIGIQAYIISRKNLTQFKQSKYLDQLSEDLKFRDQVYFLLGNDWNVAKRSIYVGMTDQQPFYKRLIQHEQDRLKDVWETAIVFSNPTTWDGLRVRYLESVFYNLLKSYKQDPNFFYQIENQAQTDTEYWEQYQMDKTFRELDIESIITILKSYNCDAFDNYFYNRLKDSKSQFNQEQSRKKVQERAQFYRSLPHVRTPDYIVNAFVDNLMAGIRHKYSNLDKYEYLKKLSSFKFLDIACKKDCEFLECIYDRLMIELQDIIPSKIERSLHILNNQLFGMAMSPEVLYSIKSKLGSSVVNYTEDDQCCEQRTISNAQWVDDYLKSIKIDGTEEDKTKTSFYEKLVGEDGAFKNMKFDVVIGNPPYGEAHNYIYCDFICNCVNKYGLDAEFVSMIVPQRYFQVLDRQFNNVRNEWYKKHIVNIVDFPDQKDVFQQVWVAGGVNYFLYDRDYTGDTLVTTMKGHDIVESEKYNLDELQEFEIIPRKAQDKRIFEKVVSGANLLGRANTKDIEGAMQSKVKMNAFGIKRSSDFVEVLSRYEDQVECLTTNKDVDVQYVRAQKLSRYGAQIVNKYKVSVPYDGVFQERLQYAYILKPGQVQTLQWTSISAFDSLEEANNCMKYMNTKFVRYLVDACTAQLNITADNFRFVPVQNFSNTQDIDWNSQMSEIDAFLYKKYSLQEKDIKAIESSYTNYLLRKDYFI